MEEDLSPKPKVKIDRNLSSFVKRLSDEEIKTFLAVLGALMARVPAPRDCRNAYLREVEKRLRNNGVDFLSKSRVFPTFGLKLLGNDREGFPIPGFKQQSKKIYPKLFAWYWGELDRLSSLKKPRKVDVQRAQRVLTVLSFSKMIKTNSIRQIHSSLSDFEKRTSEKVLEGSNEARLEYEAKKALHVQTLKGGLLAKLANKNQNLSVHYGEDAIDLKEILGFTDDLSNLPDEYDFSSVSCKPSALKEPPRLPVRYTPGWGTKYWFKNPPYGRIHIITEVAGKLRLICPYNTPFVHSTGLFCRCRAILSTLTQDSSLDQTVGHRFVQKELAKGGEWCVSADLSNFTDDISPELINFGLRCLGLSNLKGFLLNLPVTLPNGKYIIPNKLLMGLKGCFEFSTLCHHYVVQRAGIKRYTMVGDDLFFRGDIDTYLEAIKPSGWKLNRAKTVYSKTAAVFCGEMFWFGLKVSPSVPKVSSCFQNGKLRKASVIFSCVRDAIASLNTIYNRRGVVAVMRPFFHILRKVWSDLIVPDIPQKLRGLGLTPGGQVLSLCQRLERRRDILRCAKLSIGVKKELVETQRWFGLPIELSPNAVNIFESPYFPTLLTSGAVKLTISPSRRAMRKSVQSLYLSDVLEWYYYDTRIEPQRFMS